MCFQHLELVVLFFQFLIKGYLLERMEDLKEYVDFQFLIKGYQAKLT